MPSYGGLLPKKRRPPHDPPEQSFFAPGRTVDADARTADWRPLDDQEFLWRHPVADPRIDEDVRPYFTRKPFGGLRAL